MMTRNTRVRSLNKSIRCRILRLYIFKKKVNESFSADFDVKTMTFGKKVGGGCGGGGRAPIHTPDEIHHGERCIHVTLDNKVILFLLKCILIHLYAKWKSVVSATLCPCPVRNAQLITPLSHSWKFLNQLFSKIYLWHLGINMQGLIS